MTHCCVCRGDVGAHGLTLCGRHSSQERIDALGTRQVARAFTLRPDRAAVDACDDCGADAPIPPRCDPCDAELGGE